MTTPGQIVILNGAPRSGKSAIAHEIQRTFSGPWINLGVDSSMRSIPEKLQPGIGLRPGGEWPDMEDLVIALYAGLYESIAAHVRIGINVVGDVGHHDSYSRALHILEDCAQRLSGMPVLFVGIHCPIEVIWQRRELSWGQRREEADEALLAAVERWQEAVHQPGTYDLELDTSQLSPAECAVIISDRLTNGLPGEAFERLSP
jgi:chloramphenicol 3-O phosphotransferase